MSFCVSEEVQNAKYLTRFLIIYSHIFDSSGSFVVLSTKSKQCRSHFQVKLE